MQPLMKARRGRSMAPLPGLAEAKLIARAAPARLQRRDVGIVERSHALEHHRAHALLQMEDLAGAAELAPIPCPVSISREGMMTVCW